MEKLVIKCSIPSTDPSSSIDEKPGVPLAREPQKDGPKDLPPTHTNMEPCLALGQIGWALLPEDLPPGPEVWGHQKPHPTFR